MPNTLASFFAALRDPADAFFDPGRRVFWPFFTASALIAILVLVARGLRVRGALRALLSRRVWWHRSARADYQLIVVKALLRVLLLGGLGFSTLAVAAITAGWLRRHIGGAPALGVSALTAGAVFTLAAFLVEDYGRYLVHRLMHRVPLLWELHKVHHSAEVLTPLTLYRTHPIEALLNGARASLSIGAVTGVCAWAFGPAVRVWEILGVDAIGFVWTLCGANLRHSHVWVSWGRALEHVFVSPAQHQVHHSADPRHHDKNFGTVLAIWDWLGGSLYVTGPRERLRFGLPGAPAAHGLGALLVAPVVAALRRLLPPGRRVATAALLGAALLSLGCSSKKVDRQELLQAFSACSLDAYGRFQTEADALVTATEAYAAAPGDATRDAAREAWVRAMDIWQEIELMRFGPLAAFDVAGGMNLRAPIYSWPDVNRCLIEEQLVSKAYEGAAFGASASTSTRGLAAIEYLLFHVGDDNACPPTSAINMAGTWTALTADELGQRKADYARVAAKDVAAKARELTTAWGSGGFSTQLTTAGLGATLFATQQAALSAVADAVFHLDTETKDQRLAAPLDGKGPFESPFAGLSKRHVRDNVVGARVLLEGCAAGNQLGFDDLLESAGAESLAAEMRRDLDAALAAIDAVPGEDLAAADPAAARNILAAIKELTDFLKMEFTTTLQITASRVEGDHD